MRHGYDYRHMIPHPESKQQTASARTRNGFESIICEKLPHSSKCSVFEKGSIYRLSRLIGHKKARSSVRSSVENRKKRNDLISRKTAEKTAAITTISIPLECEYSVKQRKDFHIGTSIHTDAEIFVYFPKIKGEKQKNLSPCVLAICTGACYNIGVRR